MQRSEPDIQKADAVLQLAMSLYEYGQHERVLSLLKLHDWFVSGREPSLLLRLKTLVKLSRFTEAKQVSETTGIVPPPRLMAEIYWGLGEKDLGDAEFRKSLTTQGPG